MAWTGNPKQTREMKKKNDNNTTHNVRTPNQIMLSFDTDDVSNQSMDKYVKLWSRCKNENGNNENLIFIFIKKKM